MAGKYKKVASVWENEYDGQTRLNIVFNETVKAGIKAYWFKNTFKEKDSQPDYTINVKTEDFENQGVSANEAYPEITPVEDDDELPF